MRAMQRPPLVDRYGRVHRYLRVALTDRCNFRCRYCMPLEGVAWQAKAEILTLEELEVLVRLFARLGIDKVRLTGGEPTVRRGYEGLVKALAAIPEIRTLAMTTNGWTLAESAGTLRRHGLSLVNVSMDSLDPERFRAITVRGELDRVLTGIESALGAGLEVKINCVVMRGVNEDEIIRFVEHFADCDVTVRFIEFMPFEGNRWDRADIYPYAAMRRDLEARFRLEPLETDPSAVGKDFRIEGCRCRVGFVTSMTEHFCDGCDRLRITSDGYLKTCLFGREEVSLRDLVRSGETAEVLEEAIRRALERKWKGHPDLATLPQLPNRSMIQIGG
ncbi:MAG TPA: GTP 3',8-cyclase MoaA [Fimbriimonadaceae bacterium]|nr:GTP 3',8-cyclase MoaA [Fimbriimonadaceae bacterium]